jgi:radical SAM superfamily enzyme YgiQ (UPF0313 family)
MKATIVNPPNAARIVMVKEGRCMQRKEAWGYVMAPVTMVTMATMLRDAGHRVSVLDAVVDANDFEAALGVVAGEKPDLAFVNTSTPTIEDDLRFAEELKKRMNGRVATAAYGIHPTVMHEDVLRRRPLLDFCVIGEPEVTALELANALAEGADAARVPGLAWSGADGVIMKSAPRPFTDDLDSLPVPDWSFVNTLNYTLPFGGPPFLLVNTNRGCPYRCVFCNAYAYYGRRPRRRSPAHIMKELRRGVERFGVRDFMIWAEEFILDRGFVAELCDEIIAECLDIRWVCNSRVDAVDPHVLRKMRAAGCWNIAFGIESGVQEILDGAKKGITLMQTRAAVAMAGEAGLKVTGHVILGLPGETRETMAATKRFVEKLRLDYVQYYCAMPYPGTDLHRMALSEGWLNTADWRRFEHNYSVMDLPGLPARRVMEARRRFFMAYYLQPGVAAAVIREHLRGAGGIPGFISTVKDFLAWILKD